ncbi:hypothetical protein BJY52DRAFT_1227129 [Lactarius psammicola]|nr:hypothetical protein BJY52DRAFT_1227129 [Lactarius psammicola]
MSAELTEPQTCKSSLKVVIPASNQPDYHLSPRPRRPPTSGPDCWIFGRWETSLEVIEVLKAGCNTSGYWHITKHRSALDAGHRPRGGQRGLCVNPDTGEREAGVSPVWYPTMRWVNIHTISPLLFVYRCDIVGATTRSCHALLPIATVVRALHSIRACLPRSEHSFYTVLSTSGVLKSDDDDLHFVRVAPRPTGREEEGEMCKYEKEILTSSKHFWQCKRRGTFFWNHLYIRDDALIDGFASRLLDDYPRSLPSSHRGIPFPHVLLPPACLSDRRIECESAFPDRDIQRQKPAEDAAQAVDRADGSRKRDVRRGVGAGKSDMRGSYRPKDDPTCKRHARRAGAREKSLGISVHGQGQGQGNAGGHLSWSAREDDAYTWLAILDRVSAAQNTIHILNRWQTNIDHLMQNF